MQHDYFRRKYNSISAYFLFSTVSSRLHRQLQRRRNPRRSKTKMRMALLEVMIFKAKMMMVITFTEIMMTI